MKKSQLEGIAQVIVGIPFKMITRPVDQMSVTDIRFERAEDGWKFISAINELKALLKNKSTPA